MDATGTGFALPTSALVAIIAVALLVLGGLGGAIFFVLKKRRDFYRRHSSSSNNSLDIKHKKSHRRSSHSTRHVQPAWDAGTEASPAVTISSSTRVCPFDTCVAVNCLTHNNNNGSAPSILTRALSIVSRSSSFEAVKEEDYQEGTGEKPNLTPNRTYNINRDVLPAFIPYTAPVIPWPVPTMGGVPLIANEVVNKVSAVWEGYAIPTMHFPDWKHYLPRPAAATIAPPPAAHLAGRAAPEMNETVWWAATGPAAIESPPISAPDPVWPPPLSMRTHRNPWKTSVPVLAPASPTFVLGTDSDDDGSSASHYSGDGTTGDWMGRADAAEMGAFN